MADFADRFDALTPSAENPFLKYVAKPEPASGENPFAKYAQPDQTAAQPSTLERVAQLASKAAEPITSLPAAYAKENSDARTMMGEGVDQIKKGTLGDVAIGAGKTALGAANYVMSPVNAALHTIVGKPIQDATGVPSAWSELVASLALPIPKRIPLGQTATVEKAAAPTAEALRNAADEGYTAARQSGLAIKGDAIQSLSQRIQGELSKDGFRDYLAPKTYAALKEMEAAPAGGIAQAADIDGMRRVLGRAARDFSNPSEQEAASHTISQLDKYMASVPKTDVLAGDADAAAAALNDARGNYAAAKRSETLTNKVDTASRNAAAANSGQNIDNAIRQQVKSILGNPKLRSGYSRDELATMDQIVRGSYVGDTARALGNILGGGGGMHTFIAMGSGAGAGMAVHGPLGAALGATLPAVGYGLKKLGNFLTGAEVGKLDEMIRSRSPLAQTVGAPLQAFGQAAQAYEVSPTARNFARAALASRNLSNTLASVGITARPSDLLAPPKGPPSENNADARPE